MTRRIGQPDTDADRTLRHCLDQQPVRSFVMLAGAGSGKTTSLVKALDHLARTRGADLRRRGQRIACITYTDVAVGEIWGDVGNASLFHVSTIHSFLWTVVRPFQTELRQWVKNRLGGKIADAQAKIAKPRTQARTRESLLIDIERYRGQLAVVDQVARFNYGTGSDYATGILGHDDILKIGPELIEAHLLLRTLIASRFPFVFVDESQDTNPAVVSALRRIEESVDEGFCLGFFGDPMQKIYLTGVGSIAPGERWNEITKPENFRCPTSVLGVVNRIRAEDDGLQQVRGRTTERNGALVPVDGTARLFIIPVDGRRTERLSQIRRWLAIANNDPLWLRDEDEADVRVLVLVHRMAARRLGFPGIYAALNDNAPASLKDGLLDGTAWVLRPFITYLLPLVLDFQSGANFEVIAALRRKCPLLSGDKLAAENVAGLLGKLEGAVRLLAVMFGQGSKSTISDVITFVQEQELAELDDRYIRHLSAQTCVNDGDEGSSEQASVAAFLACPAAELWGYRTYIEGQSPFATQQGVKGAEFQRVLVILDDEESDYNLFSYGKYFGVVPLSAKDEENRAEGADSVVGRTRRLFYVCCSRAVQDLAVVFFTPNIEAAKAAITARGIFPVDEIHGVDTLEAIGD